MTTVNRPTCNQSPTSTEGNYARDSERQTAVSRISGGDGGVKDYYNSKKWHHNKTTQRRTPRRRPRQRPRNAPLSEKK